MGLTKKRHYDSYSLAYKIHAVKLTHQTGIKTTEVAESLGIHSVMLYRWRMEYKNGTLSENKHMVQKVKPKKKTSLQGKSLAIDLTKAKKRIQGLEKALANREEELTILKKARRFFETNPE